MQNFVKHCVNNGGVIKPLIIPSGETNGTGLFNPTIFVDGDEIYVNIRHCQYTLYHSELNRFEHQWGPLLYLNPENDITLTTTNFFCTLDSDLNIDRIHRVDTSSFDRNPLWEFVGLEDCRIVKWDDKFYLSGVRRDLDTIGTGRMELSELDISSDRVKEVSRFRIPAPAPDTSYCEKNWMPIVDKPFHYVKWSNPTEVVRVDTSKVVTTTTHLGSERDLSHDLRGGSQVIPFKDGYLAIQHVTYLYRTEQQRENATYRHRFTYWDKDWNVIKRSEIFDFMDAKIEFSCGMSQYGDDYLITFGFQDNAAYVLKVPGNVLEDFIND